MKAVKKSQNSVEVLDLRTFKKLGLSFERCLKENIKACLKYPDQPNRFTDSEVELHEELKEWDQCLLMPGDEKFDEHGNVYGIKDNSAMYLDKDGEDHEINTSSTICFLRGKAYEALEDCAQAR